MYKNYSDELSEIRSNLKTEIKKFFFENGQDTIVSIEEIEGNCITVLSFELADNVDIKEITSNGVVPDYYNNLNVISFDDLTYDDLSYIIDILNKYKKD